MTVIRNVILPITRVTSHRESTTDSAIWYSVACATVLAFAAVLRFCRLDVSLFEDEIWVAALARHGGWHAHSYSTPPLFYAIERMWAALRGTDPARLREPAAFFGVALAAIEKFQPQWWQRLMNLAPWLWLPGLALILYALYLGENDTLTVTTCIWQFPLIALGMAALLVCAISPRLPFRRVKIPGTAFIASIAYSAYLIQKLVIHFVAQFCSSHNIALTSVAALVGVEVCVYAAATILFLTVERPFLQLRHRIAGREPR